MDEDFDDMEFEEVANNSEIRYLTLELMKLAIKKKVSFKQIVKEYIDNVYYLRNTIMKIEEEARKGVKNEKRSRKSNKPY